MAIYALNLFNVKDASEYKKYVKEASRGLEKHGGKPVAFGDFIAGPQGDIKPRRVLMLIEWESKSSIKGYLEDPELAHIHQYRENGQADFVWHLFEKLEDLSPILNAAQSDHEGI